MKERSILFSAAMVRAILDGSKMQTRRIVKPQPSPSAVWHGNVWEDTAAPGNALPPVDCPYGQPGDRLWVRETWAPVPHPAEGPKCRMVGAEGFTYAADWQGNPSGFKWKLSIHMPRKVCRIQLEITAVRVERLQDMEGQTAFESDALKEGINSIHHGDGDHYYSAFRNEPHPQNWCYPEDAFRELWESINGHDSWNSNPWVWVVEFRRITPS